MVASTSCKKSYARISMFFANNGDSCSNPLRWENYEGDGDDDDDDDKGDVAPAA